MKKIITKILAGCFLLAVMYFICADAMMTIFDLSRAYQYIFNLGAIVVLLPLGLYYLLDVEDAR